LRAYPWEVISSGSGVNGADPDLVKSSCGMTNAPDEAEVGAEF